MFGKNKVKKPKHMNTWYEMSLNAIAHKIARDIKVDKTYTDIPFGHSLLDLHTDGEFVFITVKTIVNGAMVIEEIRDSVANLSYHLQPFKFEKRWEKVDNKVDITPGMMKLIAIGISNLVHDSDVKSDVWIFPYYDFFISVEVTSAKRSGGRKWINGSAYIQSFEDEYGCGGSISGTVLEKDEELKVNPWGRKEYVSLLDHSMHRSLGLFQKWNLLTDAGYASLNTENNLPVQIVDKVSSSRPDPSRRSKHI